MDDAWDFGPGNIGDAGSWMNSGSWGGASQGASAGGGFDSFLNAIVRTGQVFVTGLPRYMDAKANLVRAENALPVVYRNGRPYPIDPDSGRYIYAGQVGGLSGNSLLLILGAVGIVLLLKD